MKTLRGRQLEGRGGLPSTLQLHHTEDRSPAFPAHSRKDSLFQTCIVRSALPDIFTHLFFHTVTVYIYYGVLEPTDNEWVCSSQGTMTQGLLSRAGEMDQWFESLFHLQMTWVPFLARTMGGS